MGTTYPAPSSVEAEKEAEREEVLDSSGLGREVFPQEEGSHAQPDPVNVSGQGPNRPGPIGIN